MPVSPFRRLMHRFLVASGPILLLLVTIYQFTVWGSEALWFDALGYGAHFQRLFAWRAGAFGVGALSFGVWMGINAQIAWRNAAARAVPLSFFQSDDATRLIPLEDKLHLDRYRRRATIVILAALAWLAGLGFSARYALFLRAFSFQSTGIADSASNFDLAFFLFALPFYSFLSRYLLMSIVAALLLVVAIYLYEETIGPRIDAQFSGQNRVRAPRVSLAAAKHLALLWSMLIIWRGLECALSVPRTFVSSGNVATRVFDPIDVTLGWTSAGIFAFSAPLVALLSFLSIAREPRYRTFLFGILWMVCAGAVPAILPMIVARPVGDNDWNKAIGRHIQSTRRAWGLDAVEVRAFAPTADTPFRAAEVGNVAKDLAENGASASGGAANRDVASLALWPAVAARSAFNRRLEARGSELRVERVSLERAGQTLIYRGLALPPRPDARGDWRARHERTPRGLWLEMDASRILPDGGPVFGMQCSAGVLVGAPMPPPSQWRETPERSETIFGANGWGDSDEWILSRSAASSGAAASFRASASSGASGVELSSWGVKMLLAARFLEPMMARQTDANDRILWHRGAAQRCRELAPFLDWQAQNAHPTLISNGDPALPQSLKWIVPGLVWSDDHPDSATPAAPGTAPPGINYGRQSAVGVVDARSGATTLYLLDENEPFIALYHRVFPGLFALPTALPTEIRSALRPSRALLGAQALVWARYHEADPRTWVTRQSDYRPLFLATPFDDGGPRPLASQASGDWDLTAYARPQGQAGAEGAPPLSAILGADERIFRLGPKPRFVEWRAGAPLALPTLLIEEPRSEVPGSAPTSTPTLYGVAPRLDAIGNAHGLIVTRGAATLQPAASNGALQQWQLAAALQISGKSAPAPLPAPVRPPAPQLRLQQAIAAWRALRSSRQSGNWEAAAAAEKRLDAALGESAPEKPATAP